MYESWIQAHPWMTFILGVLGILTLNTFFVSLGGGYKKFPATSTKTKEEIDEKEQLMLD